ncbi:hypothetical protein MARINOS108_110088 [Marinoscillum sp. 108]|nr:hypothetical protein MARINOS108_110088 [Marinoscillum sp. 108]
MNYNLSLKNYEGTHQRAYPSRRGNHAGAVATGIRLCQRDH